MSENTEKNNVMTVFGRFRIVYAAKDNPYGHPDYVITRTAKEIGVEGAEDKSYFIRVLPEGADVKSFLAQTRLIADQQPLNISEIAEHCMTEKVIHQNTKGKCIGIYMDNAGKYEYFFLSSQKNNEEILPTIHPKLFILLNFLIEEKAILDYQIYGISKEKILLEMLRKKMRYGGRQSCLVPMSILDTEEKIPHIWLSFYEDFASADHTWLNRIFQTKFYNEAEKRMLRWRIWMNENLQPKGGSQ